MLKLMKLIRYDRHAKRRMREREVTEEEVAIAIREPESCEQSIKGRKNIYKFLSERFLRITSREEADHILIITVTVRKTPFRR